MSSVSNSGSNSGKRPRPDFQRILPKIKTRFFQFEHRTETIQQLHKKPATVPLNEVVRKAKQLKSDLALPKILAFEQLLSNHVQLYITRILYKIASVAFVYMMYVHVEGKRPF